jgi:amino acid adenylation domain-containing protein
MEKPVDVPSPSITSSERESAPEPIDPATPIQSPESVTRKVLNFAALSAQQQERIAGDITGGAANFQELYPLTPLQDGMFFHHLLEERRDNYILSTLFDLESRSLLDALIEALQKVIKRHDVLRSAVLWEQLPQPVQVVYREASLRVHELEPAGDRTVLEQLKGLMAPPIPSLDLKCAPPLRLQTMRDPESERWYALLQIHHLFCDYESLQTVISETVAHLKGDEDKLMAPAPFRKFVTWSLDAPQLDAELFFRRNLGDISEPTAPFDLREARGVDRRVNERREELPLILSRRLRAQGRKLGVSPAKLLHAAWALVICHISGKRDVVFGTVLSSRARKRFRSSVALGLFINTLPLRLSIDGLSVRSLVDKVNLALEELREYERTPLSFALRCSGVHESIPLFSALFNYRHTLPASEIEWPGAPGVRIAPGSEAWTNYPLTLTVDDQGEKFQFLAQTDAEVDAHRVTGYMHTAVQSLVEALEGAPDTSAWALPIVPVKERDQIVLSFGSTRSQPLPNELIHELFEMQSRRTVDSIALVHRNRFLTYGELNSRANRLARWLHVKGVRPDARVALFMERGFDMLIGIIGVLKAGAAYVPLDPTYPIDRLCTMLSDCAPAVVLTDRKSVAGMPDTNCIIKVLGEEGKEWGWYPDGNLSAAELELTDALLAYVIFTSGSTGRPKGIAMSHRSLVNLLRWHRESFSCGGQHVMQFAPVSFDVAFQEVFSTLCGGDTLVLMDGEVRRDPALLAELMRSRSVQRLFIPPVALYSLIDYANDSDTMLGSLRDVVVAGEQLRVTSAVRKFFGRLDGCRLHNHYGPTETHVVTAFTLSQDPQSWPTLPPIGRPISNVQIYVLNDECQPVPIGAIGEIYVSGAAVARGYFGQPSLAAERFFPDHFSLNPRARMYKTGDLGRWHSDGTLEYRGRNDDQVKVRGYRVELGEIEARLLRNEKVRDAVVVLRRDTVESRLVAYVTRRTEVTPTGEELRNYVKASLPEYMAPRAFVVLDVLPLTRTGKVDRRGLPVPQLEDYTAAMYEAPRGDIETALARIWQDVLRMDQVGRQDNFFALGGDSLLAVQLVARVGERLGIRLSIQTVFGLPSVQEMAEFVARQPLQPERQLISGQSEFEVTVI